MIKFVFALLSVLFLLQSVHSRPEAGYSYPRPSKPFIPNEEFGPPFLGEQPPVDNGVYEPEPFNPSNPNQPPNFPNNSPVQPEIEPDNVSGEGEDFVSDDPRTTFAIANSNDNDVNTLNQNSDQFQRLERLYHDYQTFYQYYS